MFLQPQHFQLEYIQNVRRAAAAMALLNPYLWGVRRLEVNENSIANGVFEVVSMEPASALGRMGLLPRQRVAPRRAPSLRRGRTLRNRWTVYARE